jgi:hypothetical protein
MFTQEDTALRPPKGAASARSSQFSADRSFRISLLKSRDGILSSPLFLRSLRASAMNSKPQALSTSEFTAWIRALM